MHVFITGIAGFIGFHIALFLKEKGHQVIGCDNFNAYYDVHLKRARSKLLNNAGIEVVESDIRDTFFLDQLIQERSITHLLHLAAQAGVRHSLQNPQSYLHSNIDGFLSILELLKKHRHIRCVYASSSSVYGANTKIPFSESDRTDHPCNLYAATKKSNELMAEAYHHLFGLSLIGLRYFTVYGPWGRPDMAYFSFTKALLENRPITLYHEGEMARDFTYIDDIVKGSVQALESTATFDIFNLGNNTPHKVSRLVELLEKYTGKKAHIEHLPMQKGEVLTTFADTAKSRSVLNFCPKTSLEEGLERFVSWYKSFYGVR